MVHFCRAAQAHEFVRPRPFHPTFVCVDDRVDNSHISIVVVVSALVKYLYSIVLVAFLVRYKHNQDVFFGGQTHCRPLEVQEQYSS